MLIIVEHRDLHPRLQPLLDLEAFRRLDIFEVDTAKRRLQPRHAFDEGIDVVLSHFYIEAVDAGELLEQYRLSFHDGFGG